MATLYLDYYSKVDVVNYDVPLNSLIILFVFKYIEEPNIDIQLIKNEKIHADSANFRINLGSISNQIKVIENKNKISDSDITTTCKLPSIFVNNCILISGLCSVLRRLVRISKNEQNLLGFRESCLMACSEVSVWTKFCEVDMPKTVNQIYLGTVDLKNLAAFESHLRQPVKIHNYYKIKRTFENVDYEYLCENVDKQLSLKDFIVSIESNHQFVHLENKVKNLNLNADKNVAINNEKKQKNHAANDVIEKDLPHLYSEGPFLTLADFVLFPQFYLILKNTKLSQIENQFPKIFQWIMKMLLLHRIKSALKLMNQGEISLNLSTTTDTYEIKNQSLYQSDPKRYQPKSRVFTKQKDIENITKFLLDAITLKEPQLAFNHEIAFDWGKIPNGIHPAGGGALPDHRSNRKCQQIENLVKAVLKLAKNGDIIVDFCSGTGHLGLLLAYLLPKCQVVIIENKERSVLRASERVLELQLNNVILLQCNLGFYTGKFDIGTSLHACGVATDLVINKCVLANAAFVCCPCCYGGVRHSPQVSYPRSSLMTSTGISSKDYLVMAHSADQTHDKENVKTVQGQFCMTVIDNDRMWFAEEKGYQVHLSKLIPNDCTPKNHLLVGWTKLI